MDLIALRFALYAVLFAQCGIAAFGLYALRTDERVGLAPFRYARALPILALLAITLAALGIIAQLADMAGTGWWPVDQAMLGAMLGGTDLGAAWITRITAMLAALAGSLLLRRRISAALVLHSLTSGIAIATLVWSGHAGATEGSAGTIHRVADTLHMLAAAVWFGGLLSFAGLAFVRDISSAPARVALTTRALDQFASVGTIAVAVIVATGMVNSAMTFGLNNLTRLSGPYATLLAIKMFLFGGMLAFAALNRWRLTPALKSPGASPDKLMTAVRRSLMLETLAAVLILGLVAWLGTIDPLQSGG